MFTFRKLRDRLFQLRFDDRYELCMAFLRYEEFYESPKYAGRKFTLAEFMAWYTKRQGKHGLFSYPTDWSGFNIPADIIKQVHGMGIDDPNHYDSLMWAVYQMISAQSDQPAYLIGVYEEGQVDEHEATHAMFFVNDEYRTRCLELINAADPSLLADLRRILFALGYGETTFRDEVQAYVTTGDERLSDLRALPTYQDLAAKLRDLHGKHFPGFVKDISS